MNDDFLKKHNVRPDAEFVEALYQNIEHTEKKEISWIFKRFSLRPYWIFAIKFALISIVIFGLLLLPEVQDTISSILGPAKNDRLIMVNQESIEPVAIGTHINTPSSETENVFLSQSNTDGTEANDQFTIYREFDYVSYDRVNDYFPNFILPTEVIDGYELTSEGALFNKDLNAINHVWFNENSDYIAYGYMIFTSENNRSTDKAPQFSTITLDDGRDGLFVYAHLNGIEYSVTTNDTALAEETLLNMFPEPVRAGAQFTSVNEDPQNETESQPVIPDDVQEIISITPMVTGGNGSQSQQIVELQTSKPVQYRLNGLVNEPQKFNNQGPATVSILLRYFGDNTTQAEAASILKPNPNDRNVSPWQISDYVNSETGLRALARSNGSQELVRELIANDFPVVIEKGYDAEWHEASGWYGHYLIMFGFDDAQQQYNTIDTFLGPFSETDVSQPGNSLADGYIYSYDHIAQYWQQFNYTFYLVYEADREQELFSILGDDFIDTEDNLQAAIKRAEAELQVDSANPYAWFNLGTSLTELGKQTGQTVPYERAAEAFDRAFEIGLPDRMLWYQHGPFVAYRETGRYQDVLDLAETIFEDAGGREIEEVWLHKGHAQSHLQDYEGALDSYNQAVKLNKYFYPAQFAIDYTESLLDQDN